MPTRSGTRSSAGSPKRVDDLGISDTCQERPCAACFDLLRIGLEILHGLQVDPTTQAPKWLRDVDVSEKFVHAAEVDDHEWTRVIDEQ